MPSYIGICDNKKIVVFRRENERKKTDSDTTFLHKNFLFSIPLRDFHDFFDAILSYISASKAEEHWFWPIIVQRTLY